MPSATPTTAAASPPVRPHEPLPAYYGDETDHQRFLRQIFDDTAVDYDRIERILALGTGPWYRRQALLRAGLGQGMQVLDVGIGTGLLAREALAVIRRPLEVVAVDRGVRERLRRVDLADLVIRGGERVVDGEVIDLRPREDPLCLVGIARIDEDVRVYTLELPI